MRGCKIAPIATSCEVSPPHPCPSPEGEGCVALGEMGLCSGLDEDQDGLVGLAADFGVENVFQAVIGRVA